MKILLPLLFALFPFWINAQTFLTTLTFEDTLGNVDAVQVGYDSLATHLVDAQFGEEDVQNISFGENLEVRLAQIDNDYLQCFDPVFNTYNRLSEQPLLISYMSKVDILAQDCGWYDNNAGVNNGIYPFSTILIRNKDLPVKIKWDASAFINECVAKSHLTEDPDDWYDVGGCGGEALPEEGIDFIQQNEVTILIPTSTQIIDLFNDTLSVVYLAIYNDFTDNVSNLFHPQIHLSPNPSRDQVRINLPTDIQEMNLHIYDTKGRLLQEERVRDTQVINVASWPPGIYYFTFEQDGQRIVHKIIRAKK